MRRTLKLSGGQVDRLLDQPEPISNDLLFETEILEPVEGTSPRRYRFNEGSSVGEALIQLDGAMNAVEPTGES